MLKAKLVAQQLILALELGLIAFFSATPSRAFSLSYQGDTTNQPVWLRTAPGSPPTRLSGQNAGETGMIVPYSTFNFAVEESGSYTVASAVPGATSPANGEWDNFLVLYKDSFSSTNQLSNALISIDAPNDGTIAFSQELSPGQNYTLVTTGRQSTDFGIFNNTISGSGRIIAIPESSFVLAMLVFVCVNLLLFKQRRKLGAPE